MSLIKILRRKFKLSFKDGDKRPKMHKGHYRPYNHHIQKKYSNYDNDYVTHFSEDNDGELIMKEAGIGKDTYKVHDTDNYDEYKEGN